MNSSQDECVRIRHRVWVGNPAVPPFVNRSMVPAIIGLLVVVDLLVFVVEVVSAVDGLAGWLTAVREFSADPIPRRSWWLPER